MIVFIMCDLQDKCFFSLGQKNKKSVSANILEKK